MANKELKKLMTRVAKGEITMKEAKDQVGKTEKMQPRGPEKAKSISKSSKSKKKKKTHVKPITREVK